MSSPVLRTEESVWKVAFSTWVKTLVRALDDSHGSGGWYVMAITVNMSTVNTKTEKHTLLMSFIRFWPIGSVVELDSFIDPKPLIPINLNYPPKYFKCNLLIS